MTNGYPLMIFYAVLPFWNIAVILAARRHLSPMAGMMAAMAIGMMVGLGAGAIMPLLVHSSSFFVTAAAMFVGGLAGAAAGMPVSLMAVMDGLLSGVMSGMMGAMLTIMTAPDEYDLLMKLLALLAGCVLFLLFLLLQKEIPEVHLAQMPPVLRQPAYMFAALAIGSLLMANVTVYDADPAHTEKQLQQHENREHPSERLHEHENRQHPPERLHEHENRQHPPERHDQH